MEAATTEIEKAVETKEWIESQWLNLCLNSLKIISVLMVLEIDW